MLGSAQLAGSIIRTNFCMGINANIVFRKLKSVRQIWRHFNLWHRFLLHDAEHLLRVVNVYRQWLTENAGRENDEPTARCRKRNRWKWQTVLQEVKLQNMKITDHITERKNAGYDIDGHENARHEIAWLENAGNRNSRSVGWVEHRTCNRQFSG